MRISNLPALLILAGALGACSAGSGDSPSEAPTIPPTQDTTQSQAPNIESSDVSNGITSYTLRDQSTQNGSELIHSIEINGPLAQRYFGRFCYRGNCWGNADFRILCTRSFNCELQIADRTNPGQYLGSNGSDVQVLQGTDSQKSMIEFVDPFFNRLDPNFFYQVWSMDSDGKKSLEVISKLSTE